MRPIATSFDEWEKYGRSRKNVGGHIITASEMVAEDDHG